MPHTETELFTIGVFPDVEWATRGLDALREHGFAADSLTILAKATPEAATLVRRALGTDGATRDVQPLGTIVAAGPLVSALEGTRRDLAAKGVAGTIRRVGFQAHDGLIFQKLVENGGVLVAVCSAARAADALAVLHAFGGGNAAIGAWRGRV